MQQPQINVPALVVDKSGESRWTTAPIVFAPIPAVKTLSVVKTPKENGKYHGGSSPGIGAALVTILCGSVTVWSGDGVSHEFSAGDQFLCQDITRTDDTGPQSGHKNVIGNMPTQLFIVFYEQPFETDPLS